jgi:hypothetical protein
MLTSRRINKARKGKAKKRSDEKGRDNNVVTNHLKHVPIQSICSIFKLDLLFFLINSSHTAVKRIARVSEAS